MRRAHGFTPERLRKEIPVLQACKPITLSTAYRPPFNWTALLQFLHGRATPQEWVFEDAYHRLMNGCVAASSPEAIAAIGMPLKRATTIWMLGDMVQSGALHLDERDPQLFLRTARGHTRHWTMDS
jgi:hypothetical protein